MKHGDGPHVLTDTALSVCSYYLLANPETMAKLYAELCAAIPDPASIPPLTTLEKLPYLISLALFFPFNPSFWSTMD